MDRLMRNMVNGYNLVGKFLLKKQIKTTYVGIKIRRDIKMTLLSVVFIKYTPKILSKINKVGTMRNDFSEGLKLKLMVLRELDKL
ncbi:MAG: hypothetical protein WAX07_05380 [Candidatus Altiarchaeia archaeon]